MKPPEIGWIDLLMASAIVFCVVIPMVLHYWATCWGACA